MYKTILTACLILLALSTAHGLKCYSCSYFKGSYVVAGAAGTENCGDTDSGMKGTTGITSGSCSGTCMKTKIYKNDDNVSIVRMCNPIASACKDDVVKTGSITTTIACCNDKDNCNGVGKAGFSVGLILALAFCLTFFFY